MTKNNSQSEEKIPDTNTLVCLLLAMAVIVKSEVLIFHSFHISFYVTGSKVPKLSLFQHLDFKKWMPFPAYSFFHPPLSYLNLVVYLMFSLNVILSKVTDRFSKGTSFQQKSPSTLWSHLASLLSYMCMYLTADSLEKDRR